VTVPVERVGDVAASVSWMTQANEVISLVAGLIAIAAGCFAIAVHFKNLRKP
jgi:hypothetical protein